MVVKRAGEMDLGVRLIPGRWHDDKYPGGETSTTDSENELARSYKRAEAHAGSGPKLSGRPRTVSFYDQIHIHPHQLPGPLILALRRHADERPRQPAFVHLLNGQADHASLTYAQLDRRARAVAARLPDMGFAGPCVLLVHPPGLDFLTAFFGC